MKVGYDFYKSLLDTYLSILQNELGNSLISVILYGSVARGRATLESDINLLIIVKEGNKSYYQMLKPILKAQGCLSLNETFKRFSHNDSAPHFSYLIFSEEEASKNRNIYLDILDDGIILYDPTSFFKKKLDGFKKRIRELGSKKVILEDGRWYWDLKPDLKLGEVFEL
ncbi:MAG: nucleotidyltransferase domain-containing protein [candidate division WOR-3 bacterium]|nr:nucleotidyltransferase domain-containing protein [candidate division WOR-3 bacterium]